MAQRADTRQAKPELQDASRSRLAYSRNYGCDRSHTSFQTARLGAHLQECFLLISFLAIVLVASLVRAVFGFGEALIAVPLLALILPIQVASPVAVLISIAIAAIILIQDWRYIHLSSSLWLLAPTFAGIPLGLMLLRSSHPIPVKAALALVILAFAAYSLLSSSLPHLQSDHRMLLLLCGFLAGILGGAYGMNGPPLAVYGTLRRWSPQHFRATLQGYFLPASIAAAVGFHITGLWTHTVTHLFLISLPAAILGTVLGSLIHRRLHGEAFLNAVHIGLLIIGLVLLGQAIRKV